MSKSKVNMPKELKRKCSIIIHSARSLYTPARSSEVTSAIISKHITSHVKYFFHYIGFALQITVIDSIVIFTCKLQFQVKQFKP